MFELPAIIRSCYDPPILACVLRWLSPHEISWGDLRRDVSRVLSDVSRTTTDHMKVPLPEVLLAGYLGKSPLPALQGCEPALWRSCAPVHRTAGASASWFP